MPYPTVTHLEKASDALTAPPTIDQPGKSLLQVLKTLYPPRQQVVNWFLAA